MQVVDGDGKNLGELDTDKALQLAADQSLDLVEVNADASPPICRIMDYGKENYKQKRKKSGGKKQHRPQLKQLRVGVKTGTHDIDVKINKARRFLSRRDTVKINVTFRGREHAHRERGLEMLKSIAEALNDVATIQQPPQMDNGKTMSVVLAPAA